MKIISKEKTTNLLKIFYEVVESEEYFDIEIIVESEKDIEILRDLFGIRIVLNLKYLKSNEDNRFYITSSQSEYKKLLRIQKYGYNYEMIIKSKMLNRKLNRSLSNKRNNSDINKI